MHTVLSIAGSDSGGGAGIQADLKTMITNGVYGMTVITALTAQNTTGVTGILQVTPSFVEKQLDSVFTDIRPGAVKTGMLGSGDVIRTVARGLMKYQAEKIVVDPVMVSTSGTRLMKQDALKVLKEELLPIATLVTPNLPEAEILSGRSILSHEDMKRAAEEIERTFHCAVLIKGGHSISDADDLLMEQGRETWFTGKKLNSSNTHGTGCTLSSAIAAGLAKGYSLAESICIAKAYISDALAAGLDLGKGNGPLSHGFALTGRYVREV
ncbi:MAG: bifunctional hydroxymethylpyrimidine kinase/phosphomethylpyrimidine kinase [Butyrivibrio sp.]|nr:bifunctional hydroxymethylpyrimidine kinase/phosphomethylpyrimidine kinase [Butyrivibrio sp.]